MTLIFYVALTFTLFLIPALLLAPAFMRLSPAAKRILEVVHSARPDERKVKKKERVEELVLSIAKEMRARFGLAEDTKLKQRLLGAGIRNRQGMDAYFVSRLVAPLLGLGAGSVMQYNTLFWAVSLAAVFYLLPDMWLVVKVKKRRERIRKSLPDALDLLVICVDAGLGLDQAMLRVGQELALSHPDLHQELMQINFEQLAGKPRLEAWKSAADRTQIAEFSLFVTMLAQADRFGTPIVRALSRFSDEIRLKRRQRAEEMAAKTKIKILFPLVLFIFPCIFIVLLGPAILDIAKSMHSFQ
jgi:tight adherence protein C